MPKFSIIMQSFLGEYPRAAKDRDIKIVNAVKSVLSQSFNDAEVIVIADGCEKTFDIISREFDGNEKVSCYFIPKQPIWSGVPRNVGKMQAKGDYCLYLDIDDYYGKDHLKIINDNLRDYDWVWYCDLRYRELTKTWYENPCFINRLGYNGTSNVCFKRSCDVMWPENKDYGHDYWFNQELVHKYKNNAKIQTPQYHVCHIPDHPGGKGYDIINR
jgi:glycosyltransferase involved in cell wall biosynthesis